MSDNVFTLDALREETRKRYAPTVIELGDDVSVELKSILKLRESDRKAVIEAIQEINDIKASDEDDEDVEEWSELVCECVAKVFRLICSAPKKLITALEDDDPQIKASLYTAVLTKWIGESQLGEAESSPA